MPHEPKVSESIRVTEPYAERRKRNAPARAASMERAKLALKVALRRAGLPEGASSAHFGDPRGTVNHKSRQNAPRAVSGRLGLPGFNAFPRPAVAGIPDVAQPQVVAQGKLGVIEPISGKLGVIEPTDTMGGIRCRVCGGLFTPLTRRIGPTAQIYCGRRCRKRAQKRRAKLVDKTCKTC